MTDNERWYDEQARAFAASLPENGMAYADASALLASKVPSMRRPNVVRYASAHGLIRIENARVYPNA